VDDPTIAFADLGARAGKHVAPVLHRRQVAAGREGAPGTRQDHAVHALIRIDCFAGGGEGIAVLEIGQRVSRSGRSSVQISTCARRSRRIRVMHPLCRKRGPSAISVAGVRSRCGEN